MSFYQVYLSIIKFGVFITLNLITIFSFSQTYNFENFTVEDGLAQNQILSIYQDDKGYMWFGTNGGGVSMFDGNKFRNITTSDSLLSNVVYSISQDKKGRMLFATANGLSVYDGISFKNYTEKDGLNNNRVFSVKKAKNNRVWLGTQAGVCYLENDKIVSLNLDSTLSKSLVFDLFEDSKNRIWFGSITTGAFVYDGETVKRYTTKDGLLHSFVRGITENTNGDIWLGTMAGFNVLKPNGKIIETRARKSEKQTSINFALKSKDNELWFATGAGIYKKTKSNNDTSFTWIKKQNGLSTEAIWSLFEDREGNIWMGTDGKGIIKFKYHGEMFKNYSTKTGLPNDIVNVIYEDKNGHYWFGSQMGITEFDGKHFKKHVKKVDGINIGEIQKAYDIIETKDGTMWVATNQGGVFKYDGVKFKNYGIAEGLANKQTYCLFEDDQNRIWVGTKTGVSIIENDKTTFFKPTGSNTIWDIVRDNQNRYWFTTEKGAILYDGKTAQFFNKKDGFVDDRVPSVIQDEQGNMWFGTNYGLFIYDGKNFKNLTTKDGLSSNVIYSLIKTKAGQLWIGTQKGVQHINTKKYNTKNELEIESYSKLEGFMGMECNINAAYEDSKGQLWFGTVKGASFFDPKMATVNHIEPKTHITNIRLEFENFDWTPYCDYIDSTTLLPHNLVIPHTMKHLTFDFVGLSYTIIPKVKYKFKLEPTDRTWLPATSKNEAVYSNVTPGKYTFKVKAMNNDGLWNQKPIEFTFEVLPPWYQTWWFYALCVIAIGSGIYLFIAVRTKALKKQKENLEEQVTERTKELVEEKEKVEQVNKEVLYKNELIEEINKEITDSINYAKGIQDAILPQQSKLQEYLPDSFILFRPKDIVSGDFYWMDVKEDKIFFSAADCTGHGVPGAFVSLIGVNGLNRTVNGFELREPAKMLDKLSSLVEETFKQRKDGMDLALCAINQKEKIAEFAGANNPFWLIRENETSLEVDGEMIEPNISIDNKHLFEIKADKQPVGSFEYRKPFTNHIINIKEGDAIYVFSDGYPDQFGGPKGKKFMSKNMKKLFLGIFDQPMAEQKIKMNETITHWMEIADTEQIDDICVFGVKI